MPELSRLRWLRRDLPVLMPSACAPRFRLVRLHHRRALPRARPQGAPVSSTTATVMENIHRWRTALVETGACSHAEAQDLPLYVLRELGEMAVALLTRDAKVGQ